MTTTDDSRAVWSPFAPPAPAPTPGAETVAEPVEEPKTKPTTEPETTPDVPAEPVADAGETAEEQAPETVTVGNSALRTPHSENTTGETEPQVTPGQGGGETPHSAPDSAPTAGDAQSQAGENETEGETERLTFKDASRQWLMDTGERVKPVVAGFRPPGVWTEPPASLKDLVAYAETAPWADRRGPLRMAGRFWCWSVAVPISTLTYYSAWLVQRPSRLFGLLLVYGLIAHTTYGSWLPWLWPTT